MSRRIEPIVAALLAVSASGAADAQISCRGRNTVLSFGTIASASETPADSNASLEIVCMRSSGPSTVPVTVSLGPSLASGLTSRRELARIGGDARLAYNLYREPARVSVWGDTPGVDTVTQSVRFADNGSGIVRFTIYGRVPPLQDVRGGHYSDQLLITIDF